MTEPTAFVASVRVEIDAPAAGVFQALTDPEMIRQYLFGTEVTCEWKEGSPITYRGIWNGTPYQDKGVIERVIPGKLLQSTYWSSFSKTEDKPENYARVTYTLEASGGKTTLGLTQDHCLTPESKAHAEQNWTQVLDGLKKLLEKK